MLILTRKVDEMVMIGDDIMIQVLETRGGQIRIGITAPKEIPVHRSEVYDRIQAQKEAIKEKTVEKTA